MFRSALTPATHILVVALLSAVAAQAGPSIGTLHRTETPTVNRRFELTFTISDIYPHGRVFPSDGSQGYNPFRYDADTSGPIPTAPGVNVWADITQPNGSTLRVNGFWCVEYRHLGESKSGYDRIVPVNHPQTGTAEHWHVRFVPSMPGNYSITVYADDPDPSSDASTASTSFNVAEALPGDHGVLRVTGDGSRLEYADGTPYCQFGFVLPQGCPPIADQPVLNGKSGLDVLAAAGGNFVRRWLVNTHREDIYRGISWNCPSGESYDNTIARTGRRSLRVIAGAAPVIAVDRVLIGCLPNREYTAGLWFRGGPGSTGSLRMVIAEDDGVTERLRNGDWMPVSQDWRQVTLTFTSRSDSKWLRFRPEFSGGTGEVYLDDADLRDTTPGSAVDFCMILNPSFEDWSPIELDPANLWRADFFLQTCERLSIATQLTLFDYRLWDPDKGFFTRFYGGTFWGDMSTGAWQESESVRQQKRLLKYIAARFGGYASLGLWELTNEMSPTWRDDQYRWLQEISAYLRSVDTGHGRPSDVRPITNSFWKSPASIVGYEQIPSIEVSSTHYYIYTDTHPDMRSRTPGWGIRRELLDGSDPHSPPLSYHSAFGYDSTKVEITLLEKTVGTRPGRFYKLKCWLKAADMTGSNPQVRVQYLRRDAFGTHIPGGNGARIVTPPVPWGEHELAWQAGPVDADVTIRFQVINFRAGELWLDDMYLMESADGVNWRDIVYNPDLTETTLDGDEVTWALQMNERSRTWYDAGPNGRDKAWLSGESGLFAWSTDLNTWVCSPLVDLDTTGIHTHNAVWAQTMASGAANSPIYWFSDSYFLGQARTGNDVYTPTWKGVSAFVNRLPFGSGSALISTDQYYSEIAGVGSSDPRIRIIGRKKEGWAYFWVSNSTNTWANRVEGGNPAVPVSAAITIPGFDAGEYILQNYDSYTGHLIAETRITVGAAGAVVASVRDLATDTAFIVVPTESCPPLPGNGQRVELWNMIVTSGTGDATWICVGSPDRSWGAEVIAPWETECARGDRVHIKGVFRTWYGRRQIYAADPNDDCFEVCGSGPEVRPIGMVARHLRGIDDPSVPQNDSGPCNVGLLVKCWGRVQSVGGGLMRISDGSAWREIWIEYPGSVPVQEGALVSVTGINATTVIDYQVFPLIRTRDSADIYPLE